MTLDEKKTIFVVDDNYELVHMVRFILEGEGFEAIGLYSGLELFKRLEGTSKNSVKFSKE